MSSEAKENRTNWKSVIATAAVTSIIGLLTVEGARSAFRAVKKSFKNDEEEDDQQMVNPGAHMPGYSMPLSLQFAPQLASPPPPEPKKSRRSPPPSGSKFITREDLVMNNKRNLQEIASMLDAKFAEHYPEEEGEEE